MIRAVYWSCTTGGAPTRTICCSWAMHWILCASCTFVTPRAPLTVPGWPGYHWYAVPRVGYPGSDSFRAGYRELADFHDELFERTGIAPSSTVLGGFSMGSVMSYALGLGADRPAPAGILAFSGFVPTVEGWQPDLVSRPGLRAFIAHGRRDPVIDVEFAHRARDLLRAGALQVEYHESDVAHNIDPTHVPPPPTGWERPSHWSRMPRGLSLVSAAHRRRCPRAQAPSANSGQRPGTPLSS